MIEFTWHSPVSLKVCNVLDSKDERECQEDTATAKCVLDISAPACCAQSTNLVQYLPQLPKRPIAFVIRQAR